MVILESVSRENIRYYGGRMSRVQKVAGLLKTEISIIIQTRLRDPRIGFVTLSDVTLTREMKIANVYFTVLGNDEQIASTLEGLERARPFIQNELASRVRLRYLPVLRFFHDSSYEYGSRIEKILKTLEHQEPETDNGK
jgi:ribosome-binding factor A